MFGLEYPGVPLLVRAPESKAIDVGGSAILSVIASSGVEMRFQWYHNPSDRPDALMPDATNAVIAVRPTQTTTYRVKVSNQAGETTGDPATVTVVAQPPSLGFAWVGGKPVVTVYGSAGITVRVQSSPNPVAGPWNPVGGVVTMANPVTLVDHAVPLPDARFHRSLVVR